MIIEEKYKPIVDFLNTELTCSAHSLDHVYRVYSLCMLLAKYEKDVNLDILIPAALLHDIARAKESYDQSGELDHAIEGAHMAEEFLNGLGYSKASIESISHCIKTHRFRTDMTPSIIEAKILYDADKLDALGAVGIARSFMISGQHGQRLAGDLTELDKENTSTNGRIKDLSKHNPMMEYHYKLKKIPSKLHTAKAREIGFERVQYMENFFSILNLELNIYQ